MEDRLVATIDGVEQRLDATMDGLDAKVDAQSADLKTRIEEGDRRTRELMEARSLQ